MVTPSYMLPRRTSPILSYHFSVLVAGILMWSIVFIREGHDLLGGFLFAVLLNMKHLFACLGPLYFVYLLRHHCRSSLNLSPCGYLLCPLLTFVSRQHGRKRSGAHVQGNARIVQLLYVGCPGCSCLCSLLWTLHPSRPTAAGL